VLLHGLSVGPLQLQRLTDQSSAAGMPPRHLRSLSVNKASYVSSAALPGSIVGVAASMAQIRGLGEFEHDRPLTGLDHAGDECLLTKR